MPKPNKANMVSRPFLMARSTKFIPSQISILTDI